jgi:hypothetical protein
MIYLLSDGQQLSPISTKRAITSHLKPLNTKRLRYHGIANPGVDFGQTQKCGRAKPADEIDPHPPCLRYQNRNKILISGNPC